VSGRLVTNTYEVNGPVALIMTTTAPEIEPELANRLMVLAVDEGRAQTRAVHSAQREAETIEGLVRKIEREEVTKLHHNAQRLLEPVAVVNPHARELKFSDAATRHRRDHAKLLGLIRASALAHQRQRTRKTIEVAGRTVTYIEASPADIALATRLSEKVLGQTTDELAPATRRLLGQIAELVEPGANFTRRELRERTGLGDSQLKVHLSRLVDLEYLTLTNSGPRTAYEVAAYCSDEAGEGGYRPGQDGYRPPTGRFSEPVLKPTLIRDDTETGDLSAGTGRFAPDGGNDPFSWDDATDNGHRPGRAGLRVVGKEKNSGAVGVGDV
jgi:hypothetical protein